MPGITTGLVSVFSASLGAGAGMYELPKEASTKVTRFAYTLVVTTCVVVLSSLELYTSAGSISDPVVWPARLFNVEIPVVAYVICWLFGIVLLILARIIHERTA